MGPVGTLAGGPALRGPVGAVSNRARSSVMRLCKATNMDTRVQLTSSTTAPESAHPTHGTTSPSDGTSKPGSRTCRSSRYNGCDSWHCLLLLYASIGHLSSLRHSHTHRRHAEISRARHDHSVGLHTGHHVHAREIGESTVCASKAGHVGHHPRHGHRIRLDFL